MMNIIKITYILIFVIFLGLLSCREKEQNQVTLEILNSEVFYIEVDDFHNKTYYSPVEKEKACNIIYYKIQNKTNKKYLFVLNTNEIEYFGNSKGFLESAQNEISMPFVASLLDAIEHDKSILITNSDSYKVKNDSLQIYFDKRLEIDQRIYDETYSNIQDENIKNHSFVIHPDEYMIFKTKYCLPIEQDENYNPYMFSRILIIPKEKEFTFRLGIKSDKEYLMKYLEEYKIKELKDNGVEIFDGVLLSNPIPLKLTK